MALKNMFGDIALEETLMRVLLHLERISSNMGQTYPDTAGRMRVNIENGTLPTLTNQNQQSGYSTAYDQYAQIQMAADTVRSRITVA